MLAIPDSLLSSALSSATKRSFAAAGSNKAALSENAAATGIQLLPPSSEYCQTPLMPLVTLLA
jgi:hypothetical protein